MPKLNTYTYTYAYCLYYSFTIRGKKCKYFETFDLVSVFEGNGWRETILPAHIIFLQFIICLMSHGGKQNHPVEKIFKAD